METAKTKAREDILAGKTALGIELGSTRIKAVLIGEDHAPIATGSHDWENRYEQGLWTYHMEDVWNGLQACYQALRGEVAAQYEVELTRIGSIGISAMMHGYLAFDGAGDLLVPFRTWRNTVTGEASERLTELFEYPIPQRWSIAHLYQAILNEEAHVGEVRFLTTLAGYIHWQLTGERVLGIGEASGMFPIDSEKKEFDGRMLKQFEETVADRGYPWRLREILPKVLPAGETAGVLTEKGANLLDVSGKLQAGIPFCPPEGDAGTGMAATNSVAVRTGNVSAGTSVFAMVVLEQPLSKVHKEIDLVTTPSGEAVAMVHCNNCTSDLNAWVNLFGEFAEAIGAKVSKDQLFSVLYRAALTGDKDGGGLLAYNYFSGEHVTGLSEGRPLFARTPNSRFSLANFMRVHLFTALGALKVGLDILLKEEKVQVDCLFGHGGLFKTKEVGQRILAAAVNAPVSVMETAGEGGAWGCALLAAYVVRRAEGETLAAYLQQHVFAGLNGSEMTPDVSDVEGFDQFIRRYRDGLEIEQTAVRCLQETE